MSAVTLDQLRTAPTVYTEAPSTDPGFLTFLVTGNTGLLPSTITLDEVWTSTALTGWFVLFPLAPDSSSLPAFAAALAAAAGGTFPDAAASGFAWCFWDGTTLAAPVLLPLRPGTTTPVVDGTFPLGVGRYGILMTDGSPVTTGSLGSDVEWLTITYAPQPGLPPPSGGQSCLMPVVGPSRFCFIAQGLLADPTDSPETGFDVAIRYFAPAPVVGGSPVALGYPLLAPFPAGVLQVVELRLDPLTNWWSAESGPPMRTAYDLTGTAVTMTLGATLDAPGALGVAPAAPFASTLLSLYGETIYLTPVEAQLVPERTYGSDGGWYLVPSGTFTMQAGLGGGDPQVLLCGLSGTESLTFTAGEQIAFTPHLPALAAAFPLLGPGASTSAPPRSQLLGTGALTAWASVGPSALYSSQAEEAPLFAAGADDGVLALLAPPSTAPGSSAFPLAPYAGTSGLASFADFERQVLGPVRGAVIGGPATVGGGSAAATTPQGLLVTVTDGAWSELVLASAFDEDGTLQSLTIATVPAALQEALQANDVFLAVSDPHDGSAVVVDGTLSLAGWPVALTVDGTTGTVLLFKFCAGSVRELVYGSLAAWTAPDQFNGKGVQAKLQGLFDIAAADTSGAFATFDAVVSDESWNGVLMLNVPVALDALPPDLAGLAAGLAPTFGWHHVGIAATPVTTALGPAPSSIFGVIDYVDLDTTDNVDLRSRRRASTAARAIIGDGDPGFSFRVLTLLVAIRNAQIVDFQSTIVLTVTTLFGESVQLLLPPGVLPVLQSSIALEGHLETRVAPDGSTVYTYVFSGEAVQLFVTPQSAVLSYVAVTQSEFSTLQPPTADDPTVLSEFRLWGFLNFLVTDGLDVFSFGDPAGAPPNPLAPDGLAYSNLVVDMSFDSTDPADTVTFTFDPTSVAFDPGTSTARPGSLYAGLPLATGTIVSSAAGGTTTGWLPVVPQALQGTSPIDPDDWYAVTYAIDLGTMGALASLASFAAQLVVLWTPGGPSPQAAVMIQLPGTAPGKTSLSLQDVLSLDLGEIRIPKPATAGSPLSIVITSVALGVFGIKLPPGGSMVLTLAGGTSNTGGSLGWYAVYPPPSG